MARRGSRPRGPTPLLPKGPETTAALLRGQAVMIRTRPSDRASSYGTYGQGMDKCKALAHPLPTLAALAPTSSPLQQQRFFAKATSPAPEPSRIVPSSQAIRRRNSPVKYREVPTEQSDEQHRGDPMPARCPAGRSLPARAVCRRSRRAARVADASADVTDALLTVAGGTTPDMGALRGYIFKRGWPCCTMERVAPCPSVDSRPQDTTVIVPLWGDG